MNEKLPGLLETDELRDAIVSLELVSEVLPRTMAAVHLWKWVIIAHHNALQGFMVLSLQGSDRLRVLTKKSAEEWMEAYDRGDGSYPEPMLDWFPNLYKNIKSDRMKIYVHSRAFEPSGSQEESITKLNELRGGFIHFVPKLLSFDVSQFPRIVSDTVDVIEFLAFESNNVLWIDDGDAMKTKAILTMIRSQAAALEAYYGA